MIMKFIAYESRYADSDKHWKNGMIFYYDLHALDFIVTNNVGM